MNTALTSQLLTITGALAAATLAHGQDLIAHDGFQYGGTPNLQGLNGGTGWSGQWFSLSSIPTGVSPEGMSWGALVTRGGCATTAPFPSTGFTRYSRAVAPYTDPDDTIYISCLVRHNLGDGTTAGLSFGTWENGMVMGVRPTGVYGLMTPPDTAHSDTRVPVVQGQTALLAARVHINTDATITWTLYVNPLPGHPEPAQPGATLTIPGTILPPAIQIYNDGGFSTDEIRLGRTWASVIPPIGDATGNGVVDVDDLLAVILAWGPCAPPCPADIDGDGAVDVDDLLLVITNWS
jgi:hypothetical protein